MTSEPLTPSILVVGASRGLGHAIAAEFAGRGWMVLGTVRDATKRGELHELADAHPDRVGIEELDIDSTEQIAGLRDRLSDRVFDALFINAGTTTEDQATTMGDVTTDEFTRVMVTNALGPLRVIESLQDVVAPAGLIGVMSSGQGSITNNTKGMREVYRASKAALNMSLCSLAARRDYVDRAYVLTAPGWIRTALGGDDAPFTIEETIPDLVDVLIAKRDRPGLEYLDRFGETVPW